MICAKLEEEFLHLPFIWKTVCIFIFFLEFDEQSKNDKWKEKEGEKKEKSQMWCGGYPSVMSVYIYIVRSFDESEWVLDACQAKWVNVCKVKSIK